MIYAYDYETFYSKDYSIRDLGNWAYVNHPEFDAFLLSVVGENGFEWVGNPKDFDWMLLNGADMIAHNAGFESAVTERLRELGVVPKEMRFRSLNDTADLAAYLGFPRSLEAAAACLLGEKISKDVRGAAKGKRWNDMTAEFQEAMTIYGLNDSRLELRLWLEHSAKWPAWEQQISQLTRIMCAEGVPVDIDAVEEAIKNLQTQLWRIRTLIPWAAEDPEAKALSPKAVALECRKHNVEPPKSMAKDSEIFEEWLRKHGDDFPWAKAMGQYRSTNSMLKKLQTFKIRTRPDGVMPYALKYAGAHTLRDSGDAGLNLQNLNRKPVLFNVGDKKGWPEFSVDMRGMIRAPKGLVLGVCDLSAIEPCCLSMFSGDEDLANNIRKGMDVYEAHARVTGRYNGTISLKEADYDFRQMMKVEVLGLGYGAGAEKLQFIAKRDYDIDLTIEQAKTIVFNFRRREFIPNLWEKLETSMRFAAPKDFTMELPSGREMRYREVHNYGGLTAVIPRLGQMMRLKFWGGTLTENLVQAAARDVFMNRVMALYEAGAPPILRVHDEVVCLLSKENAEGDMKHMEEIMSVAPDWWPDLPISAEGHICERYKK